jgi:hypothetical protein
MSRDPRWEECTICTAVAPDDVFTVRTYGTGPHAQFLLDRYGIAADPYMTVVDYFTSTRELAGMRRLVEDDIADRLRSYQVSTRRRRPTVSELTSRMPSSRIASTLADLERRFDPRYDSTAAIRLHAASEPLRVQHRQQRLPRLRVPVVRRRRQEEPVLCEVSRPAHGPGLLAVAGDSPTARERRRPRPRSAACAAW